MDKIELTEEQACKIMEHVFQIEIYNPQHIVIQNLPEKTVLRYARLRKAYSTKVPQSVFGETFDWFELPINHRLINILKVLEVFDE